MNKRAASNLAQAEYDAAELEDAGHTVQRFTDYHWRVDGKIDVWPTTKKYMRRGVVRFYENIKDIFSKV